MKMEDFEYYCIFNIVMCVWFGSDFDISCDR